MFSFRRVIAAIATPLLVVGALTAISSPAEAVAPANSLTSTKTLTLTHYKKGDSKVSSKDLKAIKLFVKKNLGYSKLTCTGFAENPVTKAASKALAVKRAKTACNNAGVLSTNLKTFAVVSMNDKKHGSGSKRVVLSLSSPIPTFSVTYKDLGSTSGAAPIDPQSPYWNGSKVSVLANSGTLAKTDYRFLGWNTQADGKGITFTPGNTFQIASDILLYPYWVAPTAPTGVGTLHITYDPNGAISGNVPVDLKNPYVANTVATVLDNSGNLAKPGFKFAGWNTTSAGTGVGFNAGMSLTVVGDIVLFAHWIPDTYVVSYNYMGGSGTVVSDSYVGGGASLILPTPSARAGYSFKGWQTLQGQIVGLAGDFYLPFSSQTLFAVWAAQYTVTYNANTGVGAPQRATDPFAVGDSPLSLSGVGTMTKPGYGFGGWSLTAGSNGAGGTAVANPFTPTADSVLYAIWIPGMVTVVFDEQGGSTIADSSFPVNGTIATPATTSRAGYTFAGWFTAPTGGTALTFPYLPNQATTVTLYAHWTAMSHLVTFDTQSGTPVTGGTWLTGASIAAPAATTRVGYTFVGWFDSNVGGTQILFPYSPTAITDIVIYAQWTPTSHNVVFDEQGGTLVYDTTWLTGGSITNPGSPTRSGYAFVGWFDAASGGTQVVFPYSPPGIVDITLYAHWSPLQYTVAFNGNGGTNPNSALWFTGGSIADPGVSTQAGYIFQGWFTALNGGSALIFPYSPPSPGNLTLYAHWVIDGFNVTFDTQGGTLIAPLVQKNFAEPTPPTRAGYTFAGWYTAAAPSGSLITAGTLFTADTTVYAHWTALPHSITYNFEDGITTALVNTWYTGDTITAPTTPVRVGYTFVGWFDSNVGGTQYLFPYTPSGITDIVLHAQWNATPHLAVFNTQGGTTVSNVSWNTGGSFTLPGAPTRAGYTFAGWFTASSGGTLLSGSTYSPPGIVDITIYAQWTATANVLKVYYQDLVTPTYTGSWTVVNGISDPGTPTRSGYLFTGWYIGASGGSSITFPYNPAPGTVSLYAHWSVDAFNVTFDTQGGNSIAPVLQKSFVAPTIPIKDGYDFLGWFTAAAPGGSLVPDGTAITADVIFFAHWSPASYAYSFVYQDGSTPDSIGTWQTGGSISAPSTPTLSGYSFDGWYDSNSGGSPVSFPYSPLTSGSQTFYAHWTALSHVVHFDSQGGTPVGNGSFVTGGFVSNPGGSTRAGYNFDGWYTDPAPGGSKVFFNYLPGVATDITLYAHWVTNTSLVLTINYMDQVTSNFLTTWNVVDGIANPGSPTRAGYTFDGWSIFSSGGVYISSWPYIPAAGTVTLYAHWSPTTQTATFDLQITGTPNPTGTWVTGGLLSDPGVPTQAGFTFDGWFTDPSGGTVFNFGVTPGTTDIVIYAHWTPVP